MSTQPVPSGGAAAALSQTVLPAILLLVFARIKKGKTTRILRDFCNAAVVGVRANIEAVAQNSCGYTPRNIIDNIRDLDDLEAFLSWLEANRNPLGVDTIYVDDFSLLASASMHRWDMVAPVTKKGKDDFYKYSRLDGALDRISHRLRYMGVHGVLSCHAVEPVTKDGTFYMGGPEVPSRKQIDAVPSWSDIVTRMEMDPESDDPWWPVSFYTDPLDTNWVGGDRFNVLKSKSPANFREVLRSARHNYNLVRPFGMEWMDGWVDEAARRFESGTPPVDIFNAFRRSLGGGADQEAWALWIVQDAVARVGLQRQHAGGRFSIRRVAGGPPPVGAPPPANGQAGPPANGQAVQPQPAASVPPR